ncbi:FAD-NAD(P)-binding protein [Larkinella ripae]
MPVTKEKKRIAILGAGPSGLFMYKRLIEANSAGWEIDIFEKNTQLGAGMPYSPEGATLEHVTNVSGNEIPAMVISLEEWVQTLPPDVLSPFGLDPNRFNEYKVVPRLLFGQYLAAQFEFLLERARREGLQTRVHLSSRVTDLIDRPDQQKVEVISTAPEVALFDAVIICTGHDWPKTYEGSIPGYFDSPYPPTKLALPLNHPVALRGSSLTAIDAIRTLARHNGIFKPQPDGTLSYELAPESPHFRMVMYSRNGLLPAIRFHLEESLLSKDALLSPEEIAANRAANQGFLSLDFVFEKLFKEFFKDKDLAFYQRIQAMQMEEFVEMMMEQRERREPFELFQSEYREAEQSIRRQQSIVWKEQLAILSYAMNYPAKYFCAEDMQRLQRSLMPLISVVIAFVPQRSAQELLALHQAGILSIHSVGSDSRVEPEKKGGITYHYKNEQQDQSAVYQTFVDCVGQPHLAFDDFPFKSLITNGTVSAARLKFQAEEEGRRAKDQDDQSVETDGQGGYYLKVPGLAINDYFQVTDANARANPRIYIMAVPHIGGYNPDYSGLDFSETASESIVKCLLED